MPVSLLHAVLQGAGAVGRSVHGDDHGAGGLLAGHDGSPSGYGTGVVTATIRRAPHPSQGTRSGLPGTLVPDGGPSARRSGANAPAPHRTAATRWWHARKGATMEPRVVVGLDGSSAARAAVLWAAWLSEETATPLWVVHAFTAE